MRSWSEIISDHDQTHRLVGHHPGILKVTCWEILWRWMFRQSMFKYQRVSIYHSPINTPPLKPPFLEMFHDFPWCSHIYHFVPWFSPCLFSQHHWAAARQALVGLGARVTSWPWELLWESWRLYDCNLVSTMMVMMRMMMMLMMMMILSW